MTGMNMTHEHEGTGKLEEAVGEYRHEKHNISGHYEQ